MFPLDRPRETRDIIDKLEKVATVSPGLLIHSGAPAIGRVHGRIHSLDFLSALVEPLGVALDAVKIHDRVGSAPVSPLAAAQPEAVIRRVFSDLDSHNISPDEGYPQSFLCESG